MANAQRRDIDLGITRYDYARAVKAGVDGFGNTYSVALNQGA
jgi:hypothetical protein